MRFVLETNTFELERNTLVLETNVLTMHVQTLATHTHQRLPCKTYVKMIANQSYSPPKTGAFTVQRSKRYVDSQQRLTLR